MKVRSAILIFVSMLLAVPYSQGGNADKSSLVLLGKIELHPERSIHLHPRYSGVVRSVFKSVGEKVRAGEVLARIESNVGVQTYEISSSINGMILEKNLTEGQSVNEDHEAFTVADTSVVMVSLVAYPRDLAIVKVGSKVLFDRPKASTADESTIFHISPLTDENTGTVRIYTYLNNEAGAWRPGQFVIGKVQ